jgi:predicted RNA-binding protein with RPS1 domain
MTSEPDVTRISTTIDVGNLAAEILDPGRTRAVVCVTIPSWGSEPLLDTAALAATLGEAASVYVMPTGDLSWDLTDRLPPRLDVYGGAARVWWPDFGSEPDPYAHPLFFVHARSESTGVLDQIADAFERRGLLTRERLEQGQEVAAVVTAVRLREAQFSLVGGRRGAATIAQLTRSGKLPPECVVKPGQTVRVEVVAGEGKDGWLPVSLRKSEPDPWQRLADEYREGMLVEGVVDELRNIGAFVTLLPGARGLLRKGQLSDEWVSHPEDLLEVGERLVVRIQSLDPAGERAELSLRGVAEDAEPDRVAAIHPGGPPWLPPIEPDDESAEEPEPVVLEEPVAVAVEDEVATLRSDVEEDGGPPEAPAETIDELGALDAAIQDGRELQRHVGAMFADVEQRLRQLRAEAAQVRQALDRDLTQARLGILELAESELDELTGSTEAALADARRSADDLREQLHAVEQDRHELLERLKAERRKSADAERRSTRLQKELRGERETSEALRRQLDAVETDAGRRFVAEVRLSWETLVPDDRARYPWREPALGPEFLESLATVQGVSRERVVDVSAHVVSGRAKDIAGLELHRLRSGEGGDSPPRVREDGAKAWRCNLQTSTAAARRLHYWELPDGGVELARVVYHDDFSIR